MFDWALNTLLRCLHETSLTLKQNLLCGATYLQHHPLFPTSLIRYVTSDDEAIGYVASNDPKWKARRNLINIDVLIWI